MNSREIHTRKGTRVNTGGLKEFFYTRKDLEEIENTDTPPTRKFKESLERYYLRKERSYLMRKITRWFKKLFYTFLIIFILLYLSSESFRLQVINLINILK